MNNYERPRPSGCKGSRQDYTHMMQFVWATLGESGESWERSEEWPGATICFIALSLK